MSSLVLCDPCQVLDKENDASEWCPDCEERLCLECASYHKSLKATRSHNLIKISAMSEIPLHVTSEEVCHSHDMLHIEYFCTSHDELCCRACLPDKHRTCNDVVVIDIACKNSKSYLLEDTKSETKHIIETLELINNEIGKSSSEVKQQRQKIEKEIADAKNEVFNRLEKTEKALVNELYNKTDDELDREARRKSDKIKDLMEASTEKLKQIEFVEKHGTEKQAFCLAHKFKIFLKEVESPLAELTSINSMTFEFVKSQAPANNVLLGAITKSKQTMQVTKYSPLKQKQAQFIVERSKPVTSFQFSSKFDTNCKNTNICGMIATDDGKLLLCNYQSLDNGGGIYVYHQTGQFIKMIPSYGPFDITYIKSMDQFAVTLVYTNRIQFICRKSLKCLNTVELKCQEWIYGIASTETQIYIGTNTNVLKMNIATLPKVTKVYEHDGSRCYVLTTMERVYASYNKTISTLDKSKAFNISDGFAVDIDVDNQGHVYVVVISDQSYIQRLTPDLKPDIKINIDGGEDVRAICFNKDCSKLFCANNGGRSIVTISCS